MSSPRCAHVLTRSRLVLGALAALTLPLAGACGGAPRASATPEQDALSSDLEARAAKLDAALSELEASGSTADAEKKAKEEPGTAQQPSGVTAEPEAAPSPPAPAEATREEAPPRDRCRTACRALGSMQRSAERICSLVGEQHEKCTWARAEVADARARIDRAGCSCDK